MIAQDELVKAWSIQLNEYVWFIIIIPEELWSAIYGHQSHARTYCSSADNEQH